MLHTKHRTLFLSVFISGLLFSASHVRAELKCPSGYISCSNPEKVNSIRIGGQPLPGGGEVLPNGTYVPDPITKLSGILAKWWKDIEHFFGFSKS